MNAGATFTATCGGCGSVELTADQLWLVLPSSPLPAHVDFHCPRCSTHVQHAADEETVAVLVQLVAVEVVDVPAEALEEHAGSALTVDDLIDLMLELEGAGTATAA